jgi:hypothetical protein
MKQYGDQRLVGVNSPKNDAALSGFEKILSHVSERVESQLHLAREEEGNSCMPLNSLCG